MNETKTDAVRPECDHCENGWVESGTVYTRWEPSHDTYEPCEHCDAGAENERQIDEAREDVARDRFDAMNDEEVGW